MDETNQIEPPPSFAALYTSADGTRLTRPAQEVIARYELCEDLAHTLSDQAQSMLSQSGGSERQALDQMRDGLLNGGPLSEPEVGWLLRRLSELVGWETPPGPGGAS